MKHTPGPWFGRPDHDPVRIQGAHEAGLNIAFVCGGDDGQRSEYALEAMRDQFQYTSINDGDDEANRLAQAAIAKATT